ncbi:hypothetical protein SCLARK_001260 [Spiroplasma clarkii]|nr:hypothetical protein [Spiroplasma clarkii]ARU91802.1 hypothetical protein SCLARK_001260 [Spiroplasma clarkii]
MINIFAKSKLNIKKHDVFNKENIKLNDKKFKSFTLTNNNQSYTIYFAFEELVGGSPLVYINHETFYGKVVAKNNNSGQVTIIK